MVNFQFIEIWEKLDTCLPHFKHTYTTRRQSIKEAHLERFIDALNSEVERWPRSESERRAAQERIFSAFGTFAKSALNYRERHLKVLNGFIQVGSEFARKARRFDPAIGGDEIFQATRNVWTMNGLQKLLGCSVELTPAVFAYSLLYPYTDNYLDDPAISVVDKEDFNERFGLRLVGENIFPVNAHERRIFELVGMIEGQYERTHYPKVFESLLAIHRAQEKSLSLIHCNTSLGEAKVLGISFEKGGTSVLADAYLAAGSLTESQEEFMFGYGAFLQLVDDLQDVQQDSHDGLLSVFSHTAGHKALDILTNRTFQFGAKVLERLDCFDAPGIEPLKELMKMSAVMLIIDAAGRANGLYTNRYHRELETHSPFRFSFLRKRRKKLARRRVSLMRLIEAFAISDDSKLCEIE